MWPFFPGDRVKPVGVMVDVDGFVRDLITNASRGEVDGEQMYAMADAKVSECTGIDAEDIEDILSLAYFGGIGDLEAQDAPVKGPLSASVADDAELRWEVREALASMNETRRAGGGFMAQMLPIMRPGAVSDTCRVHVFSLVTRTLMEKTDPYSGMAPGADTDTEVEDGGEADMGEGVIARAVEGEDSVNPGPEVVGESDQTGGLPDRRQGAIARMTGLVPVLIAWLTKPSIGLRSATTSAIERLVKVWSVAGNSVEESMAALYTGSLHSSAVHTIGELDGGAMVVATRVSDMLSNGDTPVRIMDALEADGVTADIKKAERKWNAATMRRHPRDSYLVALREGLGVQEWRRGGGGGGACSPTIVVASSLAITLIACVLP